MNKKVIRYRPVLLKSRLGKGYYPRIIRVLESGKRTLLPKGYKYSTKKDPCGSYFIVADEPIKNRGKPCKS